MTNTSYCRKFNNNKTNNLISSIFLLIFAIISKDSFMNYSFLFKKSGKNSKVAYYGRNMLRWLIPAFFTRSKLNSTLKNINQRKDWKYISDRVNYYNKLSEKRKLPLDSKTLGEHKLKGQKSVYFFDTYEYTRWFSPQLMWVYIAGDINYVPALPSIVKARPIGDKNQNSVLLNLNKVRHFIFVNDKIPYRDKMDKVIFRGETDGKPNRQLFVNTFYNHPLCDAGDTAVIPHSHQAEAMTIPQHLVYKFIMCLEGNDVASNLKWVMSSNSIAVMPRPTCETWFMEGRLIPNYHYIEIKPDYSDFIERISYYIEHPEEAQAIVEHAHEYVNQFKDKKRERIISLLVLKKYFEYTN